MVSGSLPVSNILQILSWLYFTIIPYQLMKSSLPSVQQKIISSASISLSLRIQNLPLSIAYCFGIITMLYGFSKSDKTFDGVNIFASYLGNENSLTYLSFLASGSSGSESYSFNPFTIYYNRRRVRFGEISVVNSLFLVLIIAYTFIIIPSSCFPVYDSSGFNLFYLPLCLISVAPIALKELRFSFRFLLQIHLTFWSY